MKKKKAFTLVELLAVIVILAIILIIAIPQIMNTIKTTRLKSMEDSAKLIATNAEKDYLAQQTINSNYNATSIPCTDVAKLSKDYSSCKIRYNDSGIATVRLKGASGGKFNGITCTGTKDNINCKQRDNTPEYVYSFGIPEATNLTYDIDYDKCMEYFAEAEHSASDNELYCTDKETSEGRSIKKDLEKYADARSTLTNEGVVTNLKYEYEQITDYNSLNRKVFIRWPGDTVNFDLDDNPEVCILHKGNSSSDMNCFSRGYSIENTNHINQVFGEANCSVYHQGENYSCTNNNKNCEVPTDIGFVTQCNIVLDGNESNWCTINNDSVYCAIDWKLSP